MKKDQMLFINTVPLRAAHIVAQSGSRDLKAFTGGMIILDTDGTLYGINNQCAFRAKNAFTHVHMNLDGVERLKMTKPIMLSLSQAPDIQDHMISANLDFHPEAEEHFHDIGWIHYSDGNPSGNFFGYTASRNYPFFGSYFEGAKKAFEEFEEAATLSKPPVMSMAIMGMMHECHNVPYSVLPKELKPTTVRFSEDKMVFDVSAVGEFMFANGGETTENEHSWENEEN